MLFRSGCPVPPGAWDRDSVDEPVITDSSVTFRLPDDGPVLAGVRLLPAMSLPHANLEFTHADGCWTLPMNRPPVQRMEYRLQLRHRDGRHEEICDPAHGRRAPGAFGDKSVIEFPGYRAPAWLAAEPAGQYTEGLPGVTLWSPGDGPMPLLVANDGPEYDRLAGLTRFAAAFEIEHRVDRKSTRLNSSHSGESRMPSSA